jgi:hypothetical protein
MADSQVTAIAATYQCKSCKGLFPADGFYVSNLSKCKDCTKRDVRKNREEKVDYYRAYDRKRYRDQPKRKEAAKRAATSPEGQIAKAAATARSRREEPKKWKARNAVNNAIRDGRLERGSACHFCGTNKRLQAHHEDYDHPLDVVWLCAGCHGKLHGIKGDFRRGK